MPLSLSIYFEHMIMSQKCIISLIENHLDFIHFPANKAQVPKASIKGLK